MPIDNQNGSVEVTSYQPVVVVHHVCVPPGQTAKIKNNGPEKCYLTLAGEKEPNSIPAGGEMEIPGGTNILGCESEGTQIEVLPC